MSDTGTTTTTVPMGPIDEKIQKSKQKTAESQQGGGDKVDEVKIYSPGAPGGATASKRPPKSDGTFYTSDDAYFILANMKPVERDNLLQKLYVRGQYGGSQRGNGIQAQDQAALADVLIGFANPLGIPWDQAIVKYEKQFPVKTGLVPGSGRRAPIQVSNTDDIKKVFKATAQNLLGRAVDDKIADSFVSMVQAQQRAQQEQYQTQSGGVVQETANVATLAEQQIQSKFEVEQRVQSAANAAGIIDRLVKGLAR
jgi:hypothetical protein